MASSNVEYYKRQKELQDIIHDNETKRANLETKLKVLCKSDNRLAKLQSTRLRSYWKKICDDQKRAQQRNQHIIQEFERIDAHLANSVARTEKLRLLKRQYEEYIERTFPVWMEKVLQIKQQRQEDEEEMQNAFDRQQQKIVQHQQQIVKQQQQQTFQQQQMFQQQPHQQQQMFQQQPHQQQMFQQPQQTIQHQLVEDFEDEDDVEEFGDQGTETPPLEPPRGYMDANPVENAFTSTPMIRRDSKEKMGTAYNEPPQRQSVQSGQVTTDTFTIHKIPGHDTSVGDDVIEEGMMSQPVQSIIVERIGQKRPGPPSQPVDSPDVSRSLSGPMAPEEEDDDDEISEIEDEDHVQVIDPPPPRSPPVIPVPVGDTIESSPEDSPEPSPVKTASQQNAPVPELSVRGLIHLIEYVQDDFPQALSLEGYYRSHRPSPADRMNIIQKANRDEDLQGLDAEKVSMIVLEQTTLVVRSVCPSCILSDSLLETSHTSLSLQQIRACLSADAQILWDALFSHIVELVNQKVMMTKEAAAVFVPCLVSEYSPFQDKAYSMLIGLVDSCTDEKNADVASPRDTLNSHSSLGGVPPLKFGSLVESKQYSDDESTTMLTPSVPTSAPKIPLNETAAYKSLLSGTSQPRPIIHDNDDDDDTDEDVEKQFASTLSPRDPPSTIPPSNLQTFANRTRVELEPLSEASSISTRVNTEQIPTAVELQSTRSVPSPRPITSVTKPLRKGGIMISSDLDTDTEIELPGMGGKNVDMEKDEEEDDFDFYG